MGATAERTSHLARWEPAKSDARFQNAFDKAAIGMALVDGDGRWLEVNEALSRITEGNDAPGHDSP